MNEKTTEMPKELDRRGDNREASNWVRTALTEQANKMDKLSEKVDELHGTFIKALPGGDIKGHHDAHVVIDQREIDRVKREKERAIKDAESKKFWTGVKEDAMKNALKAAGLFVIGLLVVGSQAKFKELVMVAVGSPPAVEVKK